MKPISIVVKFSAILCLVSACPLAVEASKAAPKSDISSLLAQLRGATGQDAVMNYFVSGIYLNALLIEKVYPTAVPPEILQRAHSELSNRQMFEQALDLSEAIQAQTPFRIESPDVNLARSYEQGVLLEIRVPKGARALNVQKFLGLPTRPYEALFDRGASLKVVDVKPSGDAKYVIVVVEMIGHA